MPHTNEHIAHKKECPECGHLHWPWEKCTKCKHMRMQRIHAKHPYTN